MPETILSSILIQMTHDGISSVSLFSECQMILFSACCICGLISGILNIQFVRAASKRGDAVPTLHMAIMVLASLGIGGCTLFTWLTCRLASSEQRRLFLEREVSLYHSHEINEKVSSQLYFMQINQTRLKYFR